LIPPLAHVVNIYNEVCHDDLYVEGTSSSNQFVGCVPKAEEPFEGDLERMQFVRNPLASLKRMPGTGEIEEGSYRRLGDQNEPWTCNQDETHQLHVIIYDGSTVPNGSSSETYLYAHWEYRWDVQPLKHYRGVEFDANKGVRIMKKLLDRYNIDYDGERTAPKAQ